MKYILLGVALSFMGFGNAQDCSYNFRGQLTDFHDGTAIVGAAIYNRKSDTYITSDLNGTFTLQNLCAGEISLEISHIACDSKTVTYQLKGDMAETIYMEHHIEELKEVSVTGHTARKETQTAQETLLKAETLKKYSALNLGDALKEVSGVSSINTGNTVVKPMINGLHSSRLLILNNNVRLQDQEWGIEHAPNVDINSADQISVIKGSGALAYGGDAIGGVVVMNPSRMVLKDSLYGKITVGAQTNGRGYNAAALINKSFVTGWFASAQGSYKRNGDFEAPEYSLTNTGLESSNFSFRAGKKTFGSGFEVYYSYVHNTIGILRASHIGNIADVVTAINTQEPIVIDPFSYDINAPKQNVTHQLIKGSYFKRLKNFGKLSFQYDYQKNERFEYDLRVGEDRNKAALDLNLQTHSITADVLMDAKTDLKFNFGILGRYQNNFANPDTGVRRLIPDYDKYELGTYFTTEYKLNEALTLDAGVRYDFNRIDAKKFYQTSRWEERGYDQDFPQFVIDDLDTQLLTNPVFDYHTVSASAGAKYVLNDKSYLLGNYSLSSRPPNPSELFSDGLHHSAARIELGDIRLKPETSNRVAATYNYDNSKLSVLVEGFYNHIQNFMYLQPTGVEQTIRGAFPVWEYNKTNAALFGIDLSASYQFNAHWQLKDQTAYIKGDDLDNNQDLIDIPAFNTVNELLFALPTWHHFSASLKSEWVLKQNRYPENDIQVFLAATNENVLLDLSSPPPAYHLLHFYTDMDFKISDKNQLNIALNVNNLLNTNYRSYLNRLRYFADDLGRNVALQLQLNF